MIIRVGDEFIDEVVEIAIERKAKLFESIGESQGDFSYSFSLQNTSDTRKKLGITNIQQTNKTIYQRIDTVLLSDAGTEIYRGFIRIDGVSGSEISCSFFSGNTNWMEDLNIPMSSLNLAQYDVPLNTSTITASHLSNSGVVFPLVEKGNLVNRKSRYLFDEDFHPFIHVKDVFNGITYNTGVKFTGELFNDSRFQALITSNNRLKKNNEDRSVYIGKTGAQVMPGSFTKVTFTNESEPYSDSVYSNWDASNSQYIADVGIIKMSVQVNLRVTNIGLALFTIVRNGTEVIGSFAANATNRIVETVEVGGIEQGDTVELQSAHLFTSSLTIQEDSWIKMIPIKLKNVFVNSLLPDVSCTDFIVDIFKMFNVIPTYDAYSKTINTVMFKNILMRDAIDLSNYVSSYDIDYVDVQSSYDKLNRMKYEQQSISDVSNYNNANDVEYGAGYININNAFLEDESDLFTLIFTAPFQKDISLIATSLPSIDFAETEDTDVTRSITSVTDNGGVARFNWSSGGAMTAGTLVRISNSSNDGYDGEFVIEVAGANYVELYDCNYDTNATATITELEIVDNDNDDQVIMLYQYNTNSPSLLFTYFSGITSIRYNGTKLGMAFAYFYFPDLGFQFNDGPKKEALYFERIDGSSQKGLKEDYYSDMERTLNDPVKLICVMNIPEKVFNQIDLISPVRVMTSEFDSLFFVNLITGYQGSEFPCTVELIKL